MVALYKDPKGERVFEEYEAPSFKVQQQHTHQQPLTDSATATIDSLKNRILELENIVAGNKQCSEV